MRQPISKAQSCASQTMLSLSDNSPEARARWVFIKAFDAAPRWIASAPGRVNLIGEHTDYNDGFVLPMATQQRTAIAASPTDDQRVTLHGVTTGDTAVFSLEGELQRGDPAWSNYVRGVIAGFQKLNLPVRGFNAVIESDVPLGGGMSSSAAVEVATASLLEAIVERKLDPIDKALLCQRAEHEFAHVPCGIMDQFISVLGRKDHLLLLDCRTKTGTLVPFADPSLALLVINTNVRHSLADGEYGKRRDQCLAAAKALNVAALRDATPATHDAAEGKLDPVTFRRARHVISENQRTLDAARLVPAGEWEAVGRLMYASHASLRDDYEVSCAELDLVVELADKIGVKGGVLGCRMMGAGFGGCAVALIQADQAKRIAESIGEAYLRATRNYAGIFLSRPGAGASLMDFSRPGE
jgi:galactokinase